MTVIFSSPYWPTPAEPPQFRVELTIEEREDQPGIIIRGEVTADAYAPLWAFTQIKSELENPESDEAKIAALYAMVKHLAQCLADARSQLSQLSKQGKR